ncbi:hypothetical protein FHU41_000297 [Psychromicrobium silvestre]|uniref:DUF3592 domain-containing protein n=1 Tax=Psychromicrobium silvestre TaxID=1645614 RepID=A0A7Y9LR55_9MICC|nr:DUF3592 domain-containing protein [Psychromicrobium silvestre]NYE94076.1 hypothetical protein [Psychromicrobium silvestre]
MSTILLAPGVELPVSGEPFGTVPARDVDNLLSRMRLKARVRVVVLLVLLAVGFALIWHVGQPLWGQWPQANAKVTSHFEYQTRGVRCSVGLDFIAENKQAHSYATLMDSCNDVAAVGSQVQIRFAPADPGWVVLPSRPGFPMLQLFLTAFGLSWPMLGWALLTYFTVRRLRTVRQVGAGSWREVTGVVVNSTLGKGGLRIVLRTTNPWVSEAVVTFGTRGISYFPIPTAGSTLTLRLAGNGGGKVLVGIPGHWGESIGKISPPDQQSDATT